MTDETNLRADWVMIPKPFGQFGEPNQVHVAVRYLKGHQRVTAIAECGACGATEDPKGSVRYCPTCFGPDSVIGRGGFAVVELPKDLVADVVDALEELRSNKPGQA